VRATRELQAMEAAYSTGSVQIAERALLDYLNMLASQKQAGIQGHDQLFGLAMTHGRLSLLYKTIGETNAMFAHYAQSVSNWAKFRKKEGLPPLEFSSQVLTRIVDSYESGMDIQWKPRTVEGVNQ